MKRSMNLMLSVFLCLLNILWYSCNKEEKKLQEKGNIYGLVVDASTVEPIRAASVRLYMKRKWDNGWGSSWDLVNETVTYDDGHFEFNDLPVNVMWFEDELEPAAYKIVVAANGYFSEEEMVMLLSGQYRRMDIRLEKAAL